MGYSQRFRLEVCLQWAAPHNPLVLHYVQFGKHIISKIPYNSPQIAFLRFVVALMESADCWLFGYRHPIQTHSGGTLASKAVVIDVSGCLATPTEVT
jgi:hypothetical protein